MPLLFNLRHLEDKNLRLKGDLPAEDLDLNDLDELIQVAHPLAYDLEVQKLDKGVLVQGTLKLTLQCECVRCLKAFRHEVVLEEWACHIPLEGEEKAAVVNDCVDLTPYIREDIVLAFPQHPLCETECKGLANSQQARTKEPGAVWESESTSAAWAELNKLKFRE